MICHFYTLPTMFSHKYTEKQLYKLRESDTTSWLNSPLPGLLCSTLACRKIAQIVMRKIPTQETFF